MRENVPLAPIFLVSLPVLMALGLKIKNLEFAMCTSCSCFFLSGSSMELLQKMFTLLLSMETKGHIIRTEAEELTQSLFIFLLRSINKKICLAKEAPWSKQRWPCN